MEDAGRWALTRRPEPARSDSRPAPDAIEHVARTLLRRYGVVFWRLLEREADWLPPWRDLLRVYRRLEARGEIRGGRFVAGFSGEQFALPDAIGLLRETRRRTASGELVSLSGADPLNLVGILTPGPKLAALTGNRLLYRDGVPVASFAGGEMQFFEDARSRRRVAGAQGAVRRADGAGRRDSRRRGGGCELTRKLSAGPRAQASAGASDRLPLQAFCQAFPNLGCFCPRISKDSFGGFVGFQRVTRVPNPKCPSPNFFASAGSQNPPPAERVRVKIEIPSHFVSFQGVARRKISLWSPISRGRGSGMPEIGEVSQRLVVARSRVATCAQFAPSLGLAAAI